MGFCDKYSETFGHPLNIKLCIIEWASIWIWKYATFTVRNWYEHHADPVTVIGPLTYLWDFIMHTDRTIKANRTNIVIKDHKNRICFLFDIAVPEDFNAFLKIFKNYQNTSILQWKSKKCDTWGHQWFQL